MKINFWYIFTEKKYPSRKVRKNAFQNEREKFMSLTNYGSELEYIIYTFHYYSESFWNLRFFLSIYKSPRAVSKNH